MFLNHSPLQISNAVYRQVLSQTTGQYDALVEACEVQRVQLDARLRTDMDQIITSKEHVSSKIRGDQRSFLCDFWKMNPPIVTEVRII